MGDKKNINLETILNAVNLSEQKASERHKDITSRLEKIEENYESLDNDVEKLKNDQIVMMKQIFSLTSSVNILQQDKLCSNLLIRGVPEIEKSTSDLPKMISQLFRLVEIDWKDNHVVKVIRVGKVAAEEPKMRPILAKFVDLDKKLQIMTGLTKLKPNCSILKDYNQPWGSASDIIYVGDNLTKINSTLFFEARKLKKEEIVKFVWTKNGNIYVKKDEDDQAYRINSIQQLKTIKSKLTYASKSEDENNSTKSEEESESPPKTAEGKRRSKKSPKSSRQTRQRRKY